VANAQVGLSEQVAAQIRERVLNRRLPAGMPLAERSLAAELGVSRTPVREALRQLEREGLVDIIPRMGAVVRRNSVKDLLEVFEVREALEGKAAALLAAKVTEIDLAVLRRLAQRRDRPLAGDGALEFLRTDQEFHQYIFDHCGNRELARSAQILDLLGRCLRWTFLARSTNPAGTVVAPVHADVVEAIATGDPEWAERVTREHLRNAADSVAMAAALQGV
jgi:DNA-binding GntR family transcriptional regulator